MSQTTRPGTLRKTHGKLVCGQPWLPETATMTGDGWNPTHKNGENLGCFMLGLPSTFCHGEWNGYEWIQWVNRYLWGHILKNGHACLANHVYIYIYVYEMGETWRSERANGLVSLRYFEILQCIYIYINMSCRKYIEYVERITET